MRHGFARLFLFGTFVAALGGAAHAETVMQQCSGQYQSAKAAGTLNGMTWNQFRSDCAAKLKAQPASAPPATSAQPAAAPAQTANPLNPAPATPAAAAPATPAPAVPATNTASGAAPKRALSPGQAAFHEREKQCGVEWKANKATLKAQTPGLTWPKYLSQCNARLKAAGKPS